GISVTVIYTHEQGESMKGRLILAGIAGLVLFCAVPASQAQTKKEAADLLVTGGVIVTMDGNRHVFEDGAMAVQGDAIVAIGPGQEVVAKYEAPRKIDAKGKLIMPGLINAHTHIPMVLLRGLVDDVTLDDWLRKYIFPAEANKAAGLRGFLGETWIDFPAPDNKTEAEMAAYTEKFLKKWQGDPLIHAAVAPHSIYTCSEKTLRDAAALARKYHA